MPPRLLLSPSQASTHAHARTARARGAAPARAPTHPRRPWPPGKPNFEVIRHDVVQPILLEVDQIYHLACPASPIHYKCAWGSVAGMLPASGRGPLRLSTLAWHKLCLRRALRHAARYNPIKTIKTSFLGTMNMLGLARRVRARFLISSTSEVRMAVLHEHQLCGNLATLSSAWLRVAAQAHVRVA